MSRQWTLQVFDLDLMHPISADLDVGYGSAPDPWEGWIWKHDDRGPDGWEGWVTDDLDLALRMIDEMEALGRLPYEWIAKDGGMDWRSEIASLRGARVRFIASAQ
ncbi:MAG: hypothetical protein WC700_17490 [Gemmatimonadaceae bacterium]|jgi:hypothetical protein